MARSCHLPAQNEELVTEHRDLNVLLIGAWADREKVKNLSDQQEVIGQRTGAMVAHLEPVLVRQRILR